MIKAVGTNALIIGTKVGSLLNIGPARHVAVQERGAAIFCAQSPSSLTPPHYNNHSATPTYRIFLSAMDSSADPSIDDLADCTTVKDYGDLRYVIARQQSHLAMLTPASVDRIVTIPGCSTLSEPKRTAVFNKAQYRPKKYSLDIQANLAFQTTADGNSTH